MSKMSGPTWLSVSPTNLGDISSGSSKTFTMTASAPLDTSGNFAYVVRVQNTTNASLTLSGDLDIRVEILPLHL